MYKNKVLDIIYKQVSDLKFNTLRQRQGISVVNGAGLPAHVRLPGVGSGFPASACFFFTAKRAPDLRSGCADIDVGDTAVGSLCREGFLHLPHLRCPDRRGKSLSYTILYFYGLVQRRIPYEVKDWCKGLLLYNRVAVVYFGDGGSDIAARFKALAL